MPTIEGSKKDLEKLIGKKFSEKELEDVLIFAKSELDSIEGDAIKIEVKDTNRPDLWSMEGIARELRGRVGKERGLPKFKVKKGKVKLIIEKSVKKTRPLMVAAIVRNVKVDEEFLIQMIQLQEKIGLTYSRRRKEAGIGLYDFDKLTPPIYYKGFKPRELKFAPLEFENELFLDDILETHPKGQEYGHLISAYEYYPIIIDSKGLVASMPPIINSNYTGKITEKTKNIFIESTGFNEEYVNTALTIVATALEERGGTIEYVQVIDRGKKFWSPEFKGKKILVEEELFRKVSGENWSRKEIVKLLERARYNVKVKGKKLECEYASYRQDILHPVDVVEDAIISFGYNKLVPEEIKMPVRGSEQKETVLKETVRDVCIGMGLQEIMNFTLTSKEKQEGRMGLGEEEFVELANPMSSEWRIFRKSLVPEMLAFMGRNKNAEYPQRLFEVGKTLELDEKEETNVREPVKVCIALSEQKVEFNEIKRHLDALCENMNWKYEMKKVDHPSFKKGFCAEVKIGKRKGIVGIVSEKVLEKFGLEMPVSVMELEI